MQHVHPAPPAPAAYSPDRLQRDWDFEPGEVEGWRRRQLVRTVLTQAIRRPASRLLTAPAPRALWALYFIFSSSGQLTPAHRFTLSRLKDEGFAVLVVFACPHADRLSAEIHRLADAVCWKAEPGYDFSAYAIGLEAIADGSPGSAVLVLNDSVLGPFAPLRRFAERSRWEFSGFTASSVMGNHIQSYAFVLKAVTRARLRGLWSVLFPWIALARRDDVIACQETRLGRVAARHMSTGAHWYYRGADATQVGPMQLLDQGFPFVKRSLFTGRSSFAHKAAMAERVDALGHPSPDRPAA